MPLLIFTLFFVPCSCLCSLFLVVLCLGYIYLAINPPVSLSQNIAVVVCINLAIDKSYELFSKIHKLSELIESIIISSIPFDLQVESIGCDSKTST